MAGRNNPTLRQARVTRSRLLSSKYRGYGTQKTASFLDSMEHDPLPLIWGPCVYVYMREGF